MKTVLLVVGRTVDKRLDALIADYVGRVKHYLPFEMVVVPELKNTKALTEAQQKEKEGELLLRCLQPGDEVVLLDEGGRELGHVVVLVVLPIHCFILLWVLSGLCVGFRERPLNHRLRNARVP